jgi:hypothetical protein
MRGNKKPKKGQIAIEFILLTAFSFASLIIFLIILNNTLSYQQEDRALQNMESFGESIRNEVLLASEMEDGYHRVINVPSKLNGQIYTLTFNKSISGAGYFTLNTNNKELFFQIPEVVENLTYGYNTIIKENNTITFKHGK